jgi:hypothetical protein
MQSLNGPECPVIQEDRKSPAPSSGSAEIELVSRELRVEQKRFYFNLKENARGRFLKIAEVSGGRSTIIIPLSGWVEFRDMLDQFIKDGGAPQLPAAD